MWKSISKLGMGNISVILADLLLGFTVIVDTFFTGIEMFMVRIEFWTIALITMPLLPFAMNKHTAFLAEKAIGAIFSLGIKVLVIAFLSAVTCPLLTTFAEQVKTKAEASSSPLEFMLLLQMVLACLVVSVLIHKIPNLAQGLINGSPSLVFGELWDHSPAGGGSRGVIGGTLAGAGAAYGTYHMATNMEGGHMVCAMASDERFHQQYDESSWLGKAKNMMSIEVQRINPFVMESMQRQTDIQMMRTNMQTNRDIQETAKGNNDVIIETPGGMGTTFTTVSPDNLYTARKTDGVVDSTGTVIQNKKGSPVTNGWTPPSRA